MSGANAHPLAYRDSSRIVRSTSDFRVLEISATRRARPVPRINAIRLWKLGSGCPNNFPREIAGVEWLRDRLWDVTSVAGVGLSADRDVLNN